MFAVDRRRYSELFYPPVLPPPAQVMWTATAIRKQIDSSYCKPVSSHLVLSTKDLCSHERLPNEEHSTHRPKSGRQHFFLKAYAHCLHNVNASHLMQCLPNTHWRQRKRERTLLLFRVHYSVYDVNEHSVTSSKICPDHPCPSRRLCLP